MIPTHTVQEGGVIYGTLWYDAVRYVGVCLSPKIGTRKVPSNTPS